MHEATTSPAARSQYLAVELRQVTELGAHHLMHLSAQNFIDTGATRRPPAKAAAAPPHAEPGNLACDEGRIDHAMQVTRDGE